MEPGLTPIGRIRSCYPEKFGTPKQPGLVSAATASLELYAPYDREEMVRGLEDFSHIWLLFLFHQTFGEGWKPTVRPPRLGGRKRVGVFASRSPHRPNHIGLSAVRLDKIVIEAGSARLELSGVDLVDRTPILDLKPYIPYSDAIAEAACGYAREHFADVAVEFTMEAERFCQEYNTRTGRDLSRLITETLRYDPRPASQRTQGREFGMLLWDVNIRWRVEGEGFEVMHCEVMGGESEL